MPALPGMPETSDNGVVPNPADIPTPRPKGEVWRGFDRLMREGKIFGADLNPSVIKKSGKGARFLLAELPPRRKLLSRWEELFRNRVSPDAFFEAVSMKIQDFRHGENLLLFASDRVIYDTQIFHADVPIGNMTLYFYSEYDHRLGWRAYFAGKRLRVVYIEHIQLREQSSGYASALFLRYGKLFHDLGFNQFRLKASLSVGKYYWAKEGFDCAEKSELAWMKESLRTLVRERGLPVTETEINRLNHAYDFAVFRRNLKVPVYRSGDGYYSLVRDEKHAEESRFPLGKAFLLCTRPWDGYKVIYTDTPRRTGFIHSKGYLDHEVRSGHRENGRRLTALLKGVYREDLHQSLVFLEPYVPGMEYIHMVHDPGYIEAFRQCVESGARTFSSRDCSISRETYRAALLAAGGVMAGIDAVMNGRVENAFCAVRPPGHHAGRRSAMGFCFINNVAVGAAYARSAYGVARVFILDWDVHHGNGTQEIFEDDPGVFYCSLHEHPSFCFPGTGRRMETGVGMGEGYTLNLPLEPRTGDRDLVEAFDGEVVPALEKFRPELILVSAGFDAHHADSIADLELTDASYVHMTRKLCERAQDLCDGRIVSVLEGGYNLASLPSSVVAHLRTLQGRS
jgi:acetoin utilization deacetylase AcuC-like enzyme